MENLVFSLHEQWPLDSVLDELSWFDSMQLERAAESWWEVVENSPLKDINTTSYWKRENVLGDYNNVGISLKPKEEAISLLSSS